MFGCMAVEDDVKGESSKEGVRPLHNMHSMHSILLKNHRSSLVLLKFAMRVALYTASQVYCR